MPGNGGVIRTGMGIGIKQGRPGVSQVSALLLVMYGSRQAIYRIHAVSHPHRIIPLHLRKWTKNVAAMPFIRKKKRIVAYTRKLYPKNFYALHPILFKPYVIKINTVTMWQVLTF
jgi:hypothetical protein